MKETNEKKKKFEEQYALLLQELKKLGLENRIKVNKGVYYLVFEHNQKCYPDIISVRDFLLDFKKLENAGFIHLCPNCKNPLMITGSPMCTDNPESPYERYYLCLNCGKNFETHKGRLIEMNPKSERSIS